MRTQHLKTITDACILANESILDLVFGCEIRYLDTLHVITMKDGRGIKVFGTKPQAEITPYNLEESDGILRNRIVLDIEKSFEEGRGVNEILGRPIQLADVLLAMGKKTKNTWAVESRLGAFLEWGTNGDGVYALYEPAGADRPSWNLLLPLSGQSDPTLEFIANLIKN